MRAGYFPEQIPFVHLSKYYADYGSGDYGQEFDVMFQKIRQVLELMVNSPIIR